MGNDVTGAGGIWAPAQAASAAALNIENHIAVSRFIVSPENSPVDGLSHSTLQVPRRGADRLPSNTIPRAASLPPHARTAFTPNNSNVSRGWTACSKAFTAATAQQRSSPVGDETPSDDPSKRRPSDHVSTTLARQRPLASR